MDVPGIDQTQNPCFRFRNDVGDVIDSVLLPIFDWESVWPKEVYSSALPCEVVDPVTHRSPKIENAMSLWIQFSPFVSHMHVQRDGDDSLSLSNRDCVGVPRIYHKASFLLVCLIFFCLYLKSKSKCLNLINWLISHNFSGYAFSSLLFIFSYLIIIMEYLELAEFSNYGTNCFRTGGTRSRARTLRIWKISREKVLAPVSHICTPVYPKYPNGVRPSTIWEKGIK